VQVGPVQFGERRQVRDHRQGRGHGYRIGLSGSALERAITAPDPAADGR
jgi:hypothetical protein